MKKVNDVDKATFCPFVFARTDGDGPSASKALKQLASKLYAQKRTSTLTSQI